MTEFTHDHAPPAEVPTAVPSELLAGRYRLGEPLGEGGMGTVYRAEQLDPVRRAVAVKLIRAGRESAGVLRRFEAERQALARTTHPHVARVFDAGTAADGRPFVVMELVDGPPLTDFCTQQKLDRRARLELFRKVCEAVTHAHQKGVIHRDLKPSNVLVGADGPKVVVVGLALAVAGAGVWAVAERRWRAANNAASAEWNRHTETLWHAAGSQAVMFLANEWLDGNLSRELNLPPPDGLPPAEQSIPMAAVLADAFRVARAAAELPVDELTDLELITHISRQSVAATLQVRLGRPGGAICHAARAVVLNDALRTRELAEHRAEGGGDTAWLDGNGLRFSAIRRCELGRILAQAGRQAEAERVTLAASRLAVRQPPNVRREYGMLDWAMGQARLWLGSPDEADQHFTTALQQFETDDIQKRAWEAALTVQRFADLGSLELAAKWRAEFARRGWLPELAPPPRPAD